MSADIGTTVVTRSEIAQWIEQGESILRDKELGLSVEGSRDLGWRANRVAGKIALLSANQFLERIGQDKIREDLF